MQSSYHFPRKKKGIRLRVASIAITAFLIPVAAYSLLQPPEQTSTMPTPQSALQFTQMAQQAPGTVVVEDETVPASAIPTADTVIWWTEDEVELLAAVISAESRGEPYDGQLAVGCVVLNRLESGLWGDSLTDVLYAKSQFAAPHWNYGDSEKQAAIACLEGERILPAGVLFFQRAKVAVWWDAEWHTTIGNHNFYEKEGFD